MKKISKFIKTTLLGGIVVILPASILFLIFGWIFGKLLDLIRPLSELLKTEAGMQEALAVIAALTTVIGVCFVIGLFVRTRIGKWAFNLVESKILFRIPTYTLVRETVLQFSGAKRFPFSSVAMVRLYHSETLTTGFVMNIHDSGYQTVFIPTGPNPTSGMIFHVLNKDVFPINVDVQETMRVIFNCGGGSNRLLDCFIASRDQSMSNQDSPPPPSPPPPWD